MVSLTARIRDRERDLDVAIEVATGDTVAVLGPNGAGKSTVVATLAGLLRPTAAHIVVGERVWADEKSWVPPHQRSVALLAQQPRLFPHLSVRDNVAFGPRSHRRSDAARIAERWLERVGVTDLADRRPRELSGGQAQRVALARALAVDPDVVLLDEPMAALDVGAVPELRRLLRQVLADRTTVIVTHEPLDALALADRAVVIESGRIVHEGAARTVLAHPRSAFGAALAGVNLVQGVASGPDRLRDPSGRELTGLASTPLRDGDGATATFAPTAVALHADRPTGSPRNVLAATIDGVEERGGVCRIDLDGIVADVTTAAVADLGLEVGRPVWISIKATEIRLDPV